MRALLIHNPRAGDGHPDEHELLSLLERAGIRAAYHSTREGGFEDALARAHEVDLVVVAGGDGTVCKVASTLRGKKVPLLLLPLGTANNIATSLCIPGEMPSLDEGLPGLRRIGIDIGIAAAAGTRRSFVEGAGAGVVAQMMRISTERKMGMDRPDVDEKREALLILDELLKTAAPYPIQLSVDGEDHSDEYLMVEIMNIGCVGPNLMVAPEADPADGFFDVVTVRESDRQQVRQYVDALLRGERPVAGLTVRRGRRVELRGEDVPLHVDDGMWSADWTSGVLLELEPGAVEFFVSAAEDALARCRPSAA